MIPTHTERLILKVRAILRNSSLTSFTTKDFLTLFFIIDFQHTPTKHLPVQSQKNVKKRRFAVFNVNFGHFTHFSSVLIQSVE